MQQAIHFLRTHMDSYEKSIEQLKTEVTNLQEALEARVKSIEQQMAAHSELARTIAYLQAPPQAAEPESKA